MLTIKDMDFNFAEFVRSQYSTVPLYWRDLTGQTVIITGSNTGLGFEAAKHLATMRPEHLILACRDTVKAEKAREEVIKHSRISESAVEVWKLDLSSFESVLAFTKKFEASGYKLHVLLSNAGVAVDNWQFTADGHEITVQTNHLSNLLLVLSLLPSLKKTAASGVEPRVVLTASEVHFWTKFEEGKYQDPISALNDKKRTADITERYSVSKILNVYMTRHLGPKLAKEGISVHCLNPGFCHSELVRGQSGLKALGFKLFKFFMARTTEVGSRTLVHSVIHEDLLLKNGPGGRYWTDCRESAPSLRAVDKQVEDRVMNESLEIIKKVDPSIKF